MNFKKILFSAIFLAFPWAASAEIVPMTPHETDAVSGVSPILKSFLLTPTAERLELFNNKDYRKKIYELRDAILTEFTWSCTEGEKGAFELLISTKPDLSEQTDVLILPKTFDGNVIRAVNFRAGTRYFWQIRCRKADGHVLVSSVSQFFTDEKMPRLMYIEGVGNVRDLGGSEALQGARVRQGMIFRSRALVENSPDFVADNQTPSKPITQFARGKTAIVPAAANYASNVLNWKTEIDLRSDGELGNLKKSVVPGAQFLSIYIPEYNAIFSEKFSPTQQAMARAFRVFCKKENYPIVFHGAQGADRTGTLAFILNGLLGVPVDTLQKDWELTALPHLRHQDFFSLLAGFDAYGDKETPLYIKIERYLKTCGITQSEIEFYRALMLVNK